MNIDQHRLGLYVLRFGLAGVFLWFGISQLSDVSAWAGIVPEWATNISGMSAERIVFLNGIFEVVMGGLLLLGFFIRIVALVLALHLVPIALQFGLQEATGIRDLGLALATLSLALIYDKDKRPL